MSLAFALKILTDLCYFMFALASIVTKFDHSGMLITSPAFVALAAYFSHLAYSKKPDKKYLRYLPLLISLGAFFFVKTGADWVFTVPMVGYLAVVVFRRQMDLDYDEMVSRFVLCLKIIPAPLVITVIAGNKAGFVEVMAPYFFLFLIITIMTLRMLRHNEEVLNDRRFRIMNGLEIALVCGFGYLLSGGFVMSLLGRIGLFIMDYVLRPIFSCLLYIFGAFAWVMRKIFGGIDLSLDEMDLSELQQEPVVDEAQQAIMEYYAEEMAKTDYTMLKNIALGVAVIVLGFLFILLLRVLMRAGRRGVDNRFGDVREAIDDDGPGAEKLGRSPRDRVRSIYRKFLRMCVREGLDPDLNLNSREVNQSMVKIFDEEPMDGLRDVYIRARYSSGQITDEDVKVAKHMLELTKKAEKAEEKRRAKVDRSAGAGGSIG